MKAWAEATLDYSSLWPVQHLFKHGRVALSELSLNCWGFLAFSSGRLPCRPAGLSGRHRGGRDPADTHCGGDNCVLSGSQKEDGRLPVSLSRRRRAGVLRRYLLSYCGFSELDRSPKRTFLQTHTLVLFFFLPQLPSTETEKCHLKNCS